MGRLTSLSLSCPPRATLEMDSSREEQLRFCVYRGLDTLMAKRGLDARAAGPGSGSEDSDSEDSGSEAVESDCEMADEPDFDECFSDESDETDSEDDDEVTDDEAPNARGGPTRLCVGLGQWLRVVPQ